MPRTRPTRAATVPGAGTLFALRAIGLVILARWLHSMGEMSHFLTALEAMASSPVACLNIVFLFLLIVLPGARARVERPFHPLPQWLRQALRFFGLLGCLFALWSIGAFVWFAGWRRAVHAVAETNGWLVVAPALYAAVVWICRPRALWRTNIAARRFALGRYAVSIDAATRTTIVWLESRKLGQYDARELSVRWPQGAQGQSAASRAVAATVAPDDIVTSTVVDAHATVAPAAAPGTSLVPVVPARTQTHTRTRELRPKIELLWDSPAAAGHNRQTVFRVRLATVSDREAARALDNALSQA
ncbi:hypothetical protein B0G62_11244 [Paraburkholderia eburnea]|uniref:Uncharacterized protein n=1 Tax=Paraburkholderia eburnea TaxID=1189126 RepID=A0A2S4M2X9_9BURK|nr:hypothetical protein [Paraburkholderia eburnea]POR49062.1 hypothetical protein B0G62_11244 [Paraburkholderia eburnea]PRZ19439.1 hypothetical protein BX588_11544 [Paraburkholderia eburnea]